MPIQIDLKTKKILLSVTELASENPLQNFGEHSASVARMTAGRLIHEKYQRQQLRRIDGYEKEYFIDYQTEIEDYSIRIQGRIDGLYRDQTTTYVEEIKSVILAPTPFNALTEYSYESYRNQLSLYCYFLQQRGYEKIKGFLIFINLTDEAQKTIPIDYDSEKTSSFVQRRLAQLLGQIKAEQTRLNLRLGYAEKLEFPFEPMREYQDQIVDDIREAISKRTDILISAPTGIGKTAAALYPALKYSLQNKLRLFYVTSKTTQQYIARQTFEAVSQGNLNLRAIILQAREKICLNDQVICHEEFCPYVRNYVKKLSDGSIFEDLLSRGMITPSDIRKVAKEKIVCPFELALDLSLKSDLIICDYNYVFDPAVALRRFFFDRDYADILLIIDEAHNLYQRGRDYYSPEISSDDVQGLMYYCEQQNKPFYENFKNLLLKIDDIFKAVSLQKPEDSGNQPKFLVEFEPKQFTKIMGEFDKLMLEYLILKKLNDIFDPKDPLDEFYYSFRKFQNVLSIQGEEFSHIFDESGECTRLKILCKDPSNQLEKRLDGLYSSIVMSATLEPLPFYRDVLGFSDDAICQSYPSPFPAANQKIIVDPNVSTRYRDRARSYEHIADTIGNVISLKPGNYFAFFPSFAYLEKVHECLYVSNVEIIAQTRYMNEKARSEVLMLLREPDQPTLVLAVQGGIFAEGVDYSGEMLLGAFVIGPALPAYTFEQELLKQYYEETYGKGFEYAYLYPGMNRVIQSVGRVIRTESDVGIILLIGQRFATRYYNSVFPRYWYDSAPSELISPNPADAAMAFWEMRKP